MKYVFLGALLSLGSMSSFAIGEHKSVHCCQSEAPGACGGATKCPGVLESRKPFKQTERQSSDNRPKGKPSKSSKASES
jgi:hypothetical protein